MFDFSSFFLGGERKLFKKIFEFSGKVENCVRLYRDFYLSVKTGEVDRMKSISSQIDFLEREADEIRRLIINEIAEGSLFSNIKEDLVGLLEKMDDVVDYMKDSSGIISEYFYEKEVVKFIFNLRDTEDYIGSILKSVDAMLNALHKLAEEGRAALSVVKNIERYEEEADSKKVRVLRILYENSKSFSILDVIGMRDFILLADNIADSAEDAGDIIVQLITKGFV